MKLLKRFSVVAVLATLALAAHSGQDPMRVDPTIYNLKLQNEKVRVFVVKFKPGQSIDVHKHPDHVVHALNGGRIMIHEAGKEPATMDVPTGATLFLPAQSHSAKNVGKTTLRLLVVEIK